MMLHARQNFSTTRAANGTPRWSPDGKWIAFDINQPVPHTEIYLMNSEGRNQHSIVAGAYNNVVPRWANDGKSIYFASDRSGDWQVRNYVLSDGSERQVSRGGGWAAMESDDGKTLYFSRRGGGLWSTPVAGGEETLKIGELHRGAEAEFAVTSTGIYLLDTEAGPGPTIMYYNFRTSRLAPVYTLTEMPVLEGSNLTSSRDGLTLLFAQKPFPQSSITMVEDFQ